MAAALQAKSEDKHTDRIFEIVYNKDDTNWKSVIYDLVRSEQMDPWNIDISLLTGKYVQAIKELKEHDFRVSGKMLLAAAILLGIKSKRLVGQDLEELDRLISSTSEDEYDDFYEDMEYDNADMLSEDDTEKDPVLIPKTPQPRIRNVSVYDLVNALEQALEVKKRRVLNSIPSDIEIPAKKINISRSIKDIYKMIIEVFSKNKSVSFANLLPKNPGKEAKVFTFIPLLHLANTRKIGLNQKEHFGDINIILRSERIVSDDPFKDSRPEYLDELERTEKAKKARKNKKKAK